jgi:hypothetical protein
MLEAVLDATRKGRQNNGLAVVQMPTNARGSNTAVTTLLGHASGQWIESTFHVAPARFDAQGAGSAVTYERRYSLMPILGIAAEDDDGEGAVAVPLPATSISPALPSTVSDRESTTQSTSRNLTRKGFMAPRPGETKGSSRRRNQMGERYGRTSSRTPRRTGERRGRDETVIKIRRVRVVD